MNRIILLLLVFSLSFCARKKSVDQKNDAQPVVTEAPSTNGEPVVLWKELLPDQYKNIINSSIKVPKRFRMFSLDSLAMRGLLAKALKQNQLLKGNHEVTIVLPRPDSGFSTFSIFETSTMDSALAANYPNLKTYGGQETKGPSESVRFDFNENGFNAYVVGQNGEWYIQPLKQGITHQYLLVYYKKDVVDSKGAPFELPDSPRRR